MKSLLALLALSAICVAYGDTTVVTALFAGLAPAVIAIVAQAVVPAGFFACERKPARRPARSQDWLPHLQ